MCLRHADLQSGPVTNEVIHRSGDGTRQQVAGKVQITGKPDREHNNATSRFCQHSSHTPPTGSGYIRDVLQRRGQRAGEFIAAQLQGPAGRHHTHAHPVSRQRVYDSSSGVDTVKGDPPHGSVLEHGAPERRETASQTVVRQVHIPEATRATMQHQISYGVI